MSRTSPDVPGTWEHGDPGMPRRLPLRVPEAPWTVAYTLGGGANCLLGREPAGARGELLWHLSVSRPNRHPSWDDLKGARYRLLPLDLAFGILLPPPDLYVNVPSQDHVFHIWEITDPRAPWLGG